MKPKQLLFTLILLALSTIVHTYCNAQGVSKAQFFFQKDHINLPRSFNLWHFSDARANSTTVPNHFLLKFIFPSFIDEETKSIALKRLKNKNLVGLTVESATGLKLKLKNKPLWVGVNYGFFSISGLRFKKDIFELVFRGNKAFENKTAYLGNSTFKSLTFQTVNLELSKQHIPNRVSYGFNIGIANGLNYQNLRILNGDLFTGNNGEEIKLNLNGEYTWNQNPNRGWGLTSGGWIAFQTNNKQLLRISIQNLGLVKWNKLWLYSIDSTYQFTGVEIGQIFDPNITIKSEKYNQNIQDLLGLKKMSKSQTIILPFDINLNYINELTPKSSLVSGIQYSYQHVYYPYLFGGITTQVNKILNVYTSLTYGGFGRLDQRMGLHVNYSNFYLSFEIQAFESLLLPKKSSGLGANMGLCYNF